MRTMRSFLRALLPLLVLLLASACGDEQSPPTGQAQSPSTTAGDTKNAASEPAESPDAPKQPAVTTSKPNAADTKSANASEEGGMAPTPASVLRPTDLKDKPFIDAKTLKQLPPKASVIIVERNGGWLRVISDGQRGWVRLLHVSSQPPGEGNVSARELAAVSGMATGRTGTGNIVTTTGIRGLSEEQLRNAEPDPAEVERLERYGVGKDQAAEYARKHGLERRQVAHLPDPQ